jgi:hypothetical protein
MPTFIMQENMPQTRFWIWVAITFLIGILITILRKGLEKDFGAGARNFA